MLCRRRYSYLPLHSQRRADRCMSLLFSGSERRTNCIVFLSNGVFALESLGSNSSVTSPGHAAIVGRYLDFHVFDYILFELGHIVCCVVAFAIQVTARHGVRFARAGFIDWRAHPCRIESWIIYVMSEGARFLSLQLAHAFR